MNKVTRVEAVRRFLNANAKKDLADLYSADMECQVNVRQLDGERTTGTYMGREWSGFTDGIDTWKPFRIPRNAMSNPEYDLDTPITFNLDKYVEGIGMTGWDWVNRCSRWVVYDFDALIGHSDKHLAKLTHAELEAVKEAACDLEYVTVRKSASGHGLHLYVFVDQVETANHNEHAALARAILAKMGLDAKFDFASNVDICGGNMWVWHRKGLNNPESFKLVKEGSILLDIPTNWRDHVKVIKGERRRTLHPKLKQEADEFDLLVGRSTKTQLDSTHRQLIEWLQDKQAVCLWDADNNMLVTHTYWLMQASLHFNYAGRFETDSKGTDLHEQNCFCFPMRGGAWAVRRFSKGCGEHSSWEQDAAGWTRSFLNREPDLKTAARVFEAVEDSKGNFQFDEAEVAASAMQLLGIEVKLDKKLSSSQATLSKHKDGRVVMTIFDKNAKSDKMQGWHFDKDKYTRLFNIKSSNLDEAKGLLYDQTIRFLVEKTGGLTEMGWFYFNDELDAWVSTSASSIKLMLKHLGLKPTEIDEAMGASIARPWVAVVEPFKEEYPGERQWNRNGARLKYKPTEADTFEHPTWDLILEHLGKGIDSSVKTNKWCQDKGIYKGSDYLRVWIASLFQKPKQPLPYLFFYSPEQNTGKSTLGDALSMLMARGSIRAATCLDAQSNFNAELDGAVLCIVEEVELDRSPKVYGRLKDWVTATELGIHAKGCTPYSVQNTTHWIHTANSHKACPVFAGDTRIVVISVDPFSSGEEIPKDELMHRLAEEASDFLGYIYSIVLSPPEGRLAVACIDTHQKTAITSSNQSPVSVFINHMCEVSNGSVIHAKTLLECFHEWLADAEEAAKWTPHKFYADLPPAHPKGLAKFGGGNFIINLTLVDGHPFHMVDNKKAMRKLSDNKLFINDAGEIDHE